ncbi:hypothetical protein SAMN05421747_12620, partial [Parapedobacter composti]
MNWVWTMVLVGCFMLLVFPNATYAQETSGSLTGRVTDVSGGGLAGATVTAVHT